MNRGQTKVTVNSTDSWLSDTDAWINFPNFTTDAFGIWSGNISARPGGEAFPGANLIILRLKRSDQSSYCCDSASVSATVTAAPVQTTATTSQDSKPTPSIDWQAVSNAIQNENFKTSISLKNFSSDTTYYVKIRGGPDADHLTKAQTKSGNAFLSDNESWTGFPTINTDGSGAGSGDIYGLFTDDREAGAYKILLRVRKKDSDSFYESDIKDITLNKMAAPIVVAAATKSAKISTKSVGKVLATQSAKINKSSTKAAEPVKTIEIDSTTDKMPLVLIGLGILFLIGSLVSFLHGKGFFGIILDRLQKHED